jgi:uncharacterized Ntn-hydrolase superfamily protein
LKRFTLLTRCFSIPAALLLVASAGVYVAAPQARAEAPRGDVGVASAQRPVATYSVVARDGETGDLGVAVQSHWFSVGSIVPWARAGVGAIATQSFANTDYGVDGLRLLETGAGPADALAAIAELDEGRAFRQVGMIDAQGRRAALTGESCISHAGHVSMRIRGDSVITLANMMRGKFVPENMTRGYAAAEGDLADRLLTALEYAQKAGGDIRGMQSAAILIVRGESTGDSARDTLLHLRVEDHPKPVAELRRLRRLSVAYEHMNAGDRAVEAGDMERALGEYAAAQSLAPENVEMSFWAGVTLAGEGRVEEAKPLLAVAFADETGEWEELLRRLPDAGILPDDEALIATLLGEPIDERKAPEGAGR